MHHFHEPAGSSETNDPAGWDRASYTPDLFAELGEPLPAAPNGYRAAALYHLQLMYAVDEFMTAASDSRVAVVAVAVVLGWPSARGLSVGKHCRPTRVLAVDVDPFNHPIQDVGRARFRRPPRVGSARCRVLNVE